MISNKIFMKFLPDYDILRKINIVLFKICTIVKERLVLCEVTAWAMLEDREKLYNYALDQGWERKL